MKEIYKFADIPVEITHRGTYLSDKCKDYLAEEKEAAFGICITDEDIQYEREHSEDDIKYSKAYLEYISAYRKFSEKSVDYGVVLCHGSVVEVDGMAYMFTAASGTGKSTHTKLWREYFGDRAIMINDDKPLLRFKEDGVYVYGTPWDGKHHISTNKSAKLAGICLLRQDKENSIRKMEPQESLTMLMNQTYRPRNAEALLKTFDYIDELINRVPMYNMGCTISEEAVEVAYKAMSEGK